MTTLITSLPVMLGIMFIIAAGVTLVVFIIYWFTRSGRSGGRDTADGSGYTPYGDNSPASNSYDSGNHHSHGHSSHHDSGGGHHGHSSDGGGHSGSDGGSSGGDGGGGGGGGDGGGGGGD